MNEFEAMYKGVNYLVKNIKKSGKFNYQREADTNTRLKGKYNLLRHLGSVWAISELTLTHDLKVDKVKLLRAWRYAERYIAIDPPEYKNELKVNIVFLEKTKVKLGGQALAILAKTQLAKLLNKPHIYPNTGWLITSTEDLFFPGHKPGSYEEDISTLHWVTRESTGFESEYYLGEYLLALSILPNLMHKAHYLADYIQKKYKDNPIPNHWAAQALCHLPKYSGRIPFAKTLAKTILDNTDQYRGHNSSNHVTRLACRLEALCALSIILPTDQNIMAEIKKSMGILLMYQDLDGGFIDKGIKQIDTTQHAINAINLYLKLKHVK